MSSVVAIAGGSGGLGRAIVEALKTSKYETVILGRSANPKLEAELGVRILAADYTSPDALVALLEEHKIDTIISVVNSVMDITPELNLIYAADRSKVTRRFIPNIWSGLEYKAKHAASPIAPLRIKVQETLKETGLEWTAIYIGMFLDYYAPGLPSYVQQFPMAVDTLNNVAGIPGTGERPVHFTHTSDVGKFVVAVLGLDKWEQKYFIAGDKKSWNELVEIAEQVKGVKFDVTYDSIEKMATGQITELPVHKQAYGLGGLTKSMVLGIFPLLGTWYEQGMWDFGDGTFLNDIFPEIKTLGLKEALERNFPAK